MNAKHRFLGALEGQALLERCGVRPQRQGRLLWRRRAVAGQEAWLLTNPTPEPVTECLSVRGWDTVCDLLDEPLSREAGDVTLTVDSWDVRVLILERNMGS